MMPARARMRFLHRHGRLLVGAGALLAAAAAWLLAPRPGAGDGVRAPARVLVVDASASVVRRRPDWLPWVRARLADEARAAQAAGQDVAAVVFAAGVEQRLAPGPPARLLDALAARGGAPFDPSAADDGASELAAALRVAEAAALDPRRPPGEVVLLGDGTSTGESPGPVWARLAAGGARARRVEPPPPRLGDAALVALVLPPALEAGAPLAARAELFFAGPMPAGAALELTEERPSGTRARRLPLDAPPAGGALRVPIALGPVEPGRTVLRARLALPGGDPVPENDAAQAACVARGALVVGAAAPADERPALEAWLARAPGILPGVQVLFLAPAEIAGALADLDALATFDLAPDELPEELLASFVLRGGGWLATAGYGFLADFDAGSSEERLHALLPLRPAPPGGARDVVLLVDGSGSMAGEPFERVRAAALELVASAPPSDRVLLRFFTGALEQPRVLRPASAGPLDRAASRAETARALLAARAPGGPTRIHASLAALAEERARAVLPGGEGGEALVLLLSDGREAQASEPGVPDASELRARLRASRTALRVIAAGPDADEAFLARLVEPGEELIRAAQPGDLGAIFRREVLRGRVIEGAAIELRAPGGDALAEELLAPGDPPPLERLVRCEAREGAAVLCATAGGDPALAAWRAGLGRAALFASSPQPGWAGRWGAEVERCGPLLRWLGRDRPRDPRAELAGDVVSVAGLGPEWPPLCRAVLRAPGAEPRVLQLALAPEHPNDPGLGRRAARLAGPAPRGGDLLLELAAPGGGPALVLSLSAPPPAEFRPAAAGGPVPLLGLDPAASSATRPQGPHGMGAGGAARPLGLLLLALSAALLFLGGLGLGAPGVQAPGKTIR